MNEPTTTDIIDVLDLPEPSFQEQIEISDDKEAEQERIERVRDNKIVDPVGRSVYGDKFEKFHKVDQLRHLIPRFKELYYHEMETDPKARVKYILRKFNDELEDEGLTFYPYLTVLRGWRKKWDVDIFGKLGLTPPVKISKRRDPTQVISTMKYGLEGSTRQRVVPQYQQLEDGIQSLGGELLNDAFQMLEDDRENGEIYEPDELVHRKKHVLAVFANVTKMVHGKANLALKAAGEARETANFMMDLMKEATSGSMTLGDIEVLKGQYAPKQEPIHVIPD